MRTNWQLQILTSGINASYFTFLEFVQRKPGFIAERRNCIFFSAKGLVLPCAQMWLKSASSWEEVDNIAVNTPSFLSRLWDIKTGPAHTGANNLVRAVFPSVITCESNWMITWHTPLRHRGSNIQIITPAASREQLHWAMAALSSCSTQTHKHSQVCLDREAVW